jgi:broad specificity polyphosphatase/5'/3'-nucleotidase SurE
LTAAHYHVRGVAISVTKEDRSALGAAGDIGVAAAGWLVSSGAPVSLNVNVPVRSGFDSPHELRSATIARTSRGKATLRQVEAEGKLVREFVASGLTGEPDSDSELLRRGYATVTPLSLSLDASQLLVDGQQIEIAVRYPRPSSEFSRQV